MGSTPTCAVDHAAAQASSVKDLRERHHIAACDLAQRFDRIHQHDEEGQQIEQRREQQEQVDEACV